MILYTYQSMESIFPVNEDDYNKQQLVDIPGGQLLVEPVPSAENSVAGSGSGKFRIVKLLSTDPNMYLETKYQPGEVYDGPVG
ncbi:YlzJ-like family protein [Evansella sp. LMS18]|uniref:YlzJ-like family protein n=1 Tax=Evansella sp. LMS18 TaxID=2924033 RepID=UPI0020D1946F|nr:YlzJ-like family protein [Evansella sp. LMS18]UTR10813.1 YlzJ-like family protein [Evansella sp. LMS18]